MNEASRWNIKKSPTGFQICKGEHGRGEGCKWEEYVPRRLLLTLWTWGRHTLSQHDYDEIRPFAEEEAPLPRPPETKSTVA